MSPSRQNDLPPSPSSVKDDIVWGVSSFLVFAVLLCAWATVVRIVSGPGPFERDQITYPKALLLYLGLGVLGGVVLGIVRPLTRTRRGTLIAGALVGAAILWSIGTFAVGIEAATRPFMLSVLLTFGSAAGAMVAALR